jgi:lactoylglutathione lyase
MIKRLGKVTLYVKSQDEAKRFWTVKMGFVVSFEQQIGPGMTWIEVSPKGQNQTSLVLYSKDLMLQQNPEMVAHASLMFVADDVQATYNDLITNGVEVGEFQNLPYGKMFTFKDNDGNQYLIRD